MATIRKRADFNLRSLLFLALSSFILLGIGYKTFEWNTVKNLANLHRKSWAEELSLVEESDKRQENNLEQINKLEDPKAGVKELSETLDKLISASKLTNEDYAYYLQVLKRNREEYEKIKISASLLAGKTGNVARDILNNQIGYYEKEIEDAEISTIGVYLLVNTFNVWKDWFVLNDFSNKTRVSPEINYPKYFPDIAILEKYTKDNFKFDEEDKIKQYYPENYEYLSKSKRYFSSFYQIAKDYVSGDYEAVRYKWPRLRQESLEINPNLERLFSEGEKQSIERSKKIVESVFNLVKSIKKFKGSGLGNYPFSRKVEGWKDDLILCQMYQYKASIFNTITKKYPESKSVNDLLKELNQISPRTEEVDAKFDENALVFTNDDKVMKFECVDNDQKRTYTFKIVK